MGNRVNIQIKDSLKKQPAQCTIYIHWNGGEESTHAFFNAVFDFMASQSRSGDLEYFTARFIQTIGQFFGGALSLAVNNRPLNSDEGFNDNPGKVFDVNQRAETYFKGDQLEKYQYIYKDCLGYLFSTLSEWEFKQQNPENQKKALGYPKTKTDTLEQVKKATTAK